MNIIFKHNFEGVYGVSPESLNKPLRIADNIFDGCTMHQYTVYDKHGNSYTVQSYDSYEDIVRSMNDIFDSSESFGD